MAPVPLDTPNPTLGQLGIRVYRRGDAEVLAVSGEVDHGTAAEFREEITRCLKTAPPVLVLDLHGVSFFSSVGLSALVEAQEGAAPDTAVRIVADNRAVRRPIEATALDQVLSVFSSVDEALS
ncbi:STAS domain-containing protein [Actinophytocola oryzae]|nr:STAS domain-containing protein [Actinophytocola oryzae]